MHEIIVTAVGNVASDLRSISTSTGATMVTFRLANTPRRRRRDSNQFEDLDTNYLTVTCWRWLAENVLASVSKGDPVVVQGWLRVRHWEKEDRSGTSVDIEASLVAPDLNRGVATFQRGRRTPDRGAADALDTAVAAVMSADGSVSSTDDPAQPAQPAADPAVAGAAA